MNKETENKSNKPVAKYRAANVTASVWENSGINKETGKNYLIHSVTLQRSYKDKEGEWQNAQSLNRDDIPRAVLVLNQAYEQLMRAPSDTED